MSDFAKTSLSASQQKELLVPEPAIREYLGLGPLQKAMLTRNTSVTKFSINDSPDPRLNGTYFRADEVVRLLRAHAQSGGVTLDEIADQLRSHAGLPRSI